LPEGVKVPEKVDDILLGKRKNSELTETPIEEEKSGSVCLSKHKKYFK
jgi:hypothetical protein